MKEVLAFTIFLMTACAGAQSNSSNVLVGEWRYADATQACHYIFNRNGTFKGEVTYHLKVISKFTGRWSIKGDSLHYIYVKDELGRIPAGATDRDRLLRIQADYFVIEAADGKRRKYFRIQ